MRLLPIAAALGMAFAVSTAQAASISYTDTAAIATTNYSSNFTLQQFDSATYGTLTSIKFTLAGNVTGIIKIENLDAGTATITSNLTATLTLSRPSAGGTIVVTTPLASYTDNMAAYDGTFDFDGTSGKTYGSVTGSDSDTVTLTGGTDLALFTGTGTITLPFTAAGASSATGAGNVVSQFNTNAGGQVTVEYFYNPIITVPEPLSLSLLGAGLLGLGVVRARRKA